MAGPATGTLASDPATFPPRTQAFGTFDATGPRAAATGSYSEWVGAHGQIFFEYYIDEEVTLSTSGATSDTTATIPAGTQQVIIASRVTTTITTAVNYSLGISGAATRFTAATTNVTAGDTDAGGSAASQYATATAIRITANATPGAGAIRIVAKCVGVRPPTS